MDPPTRLFLAGAQGQGSNLFTIHSQEPQRGIKALCVECPVGPICKVARNVAPMILESLLIALIDGVLHTWFQRTNGYAPCPLCGLRRLPQLNTHTPEVSDRGKAVFL